MKEEIEFSERLIIPENPEINRVYHEHTQRYEFASKHVENKLVLDSGCGTGYGPKILAKKARKVIGVDISEKAMKHCIENYKTSNVEYARMNSVDLGFGNECFDVVVMFEVIEHMSKYKEALRESIRVLRKNGLLIISTPNKKKYEKLLKGLKNPYHMKEFTLKEFGKLLRNNFEKIDFYSQLTDHESFKKRVKLEYFFNNIPKFIKYIFGRKRLEIVKNLILKRYGLNDMGDFLKIKEIDEDADFFLAVCHK